MNLNIEQLKYLDNLAKDYDGGLLGIVVREALSRELDCGNKEKVK